MTVLQELVELFGRRAERESWPPKNFSRESIGAEVVLNADGTVAAIRSLMAPDVKGKLHARKMVVPSAVNRSSGILPNKLWDKTSYSLGVTLVEDEQGGKVPGQKKRTQDEHAAFKAEQINLLKDTSEASLKSMVAFCSSWKPEKIGEYDFPIELLDQNVVFSLSDGSWVHEQPEVASLLDVVTNYDDQTVTCLATGEKGVATRLHPAIKGVYGAQSSGARLVSFNDSSYTSYGKEQGANAPVSEDAAFAYGTALNALLSKDSRNTIRVADTSLVFWASGSSADVEDTAEYAIARAWGIKESGNTEIENETVLRDKLKSLSSGLTPVAGFEPDARFFVLGLAPNAARLSVRFWYTTTFGHLAGNVLKFWEECDIQPSPFVYEGLLRLPKPWSLMFDLAAQHDVGNIPANLGGSMMRSIISGSNFPSTLLATIIGRLRVEGEPDFSKHGNIDGRRAAMTRSILVRNFKQEVPVALDEHVTDVAYLLGRLFGAYTYAEISYQNRGASLRSKYMGSASATPARVFPMLMRGYEHNLSSLLKSGDQRAGSGVKADKAVSRIMSCLPGGGELPTALALEEQGRFFIGFYHQLSEFYSKSDDDVQAAGKSAEELASQ